MVRLVLLLMALAAGGCASLGGDDPRDPMEGFNRGVYRVNDKIDQYVGQPVAKGYRKVIPGEIRDRVRNFFGNIGDVFIGVNNFLQGKFADGFNDWVRVGFNTTFGILGIHDVATDMGYEKHDEDFGQTFGRWGMGPGPYLVLPVLGSSTVRDGIGKGVDFYTFADEPCVVCAGSDMYHRHLAAQDHAHEKKIPDSLNESAKAALPRPGDGRKVYIKGQTAAEAAAARDSSGG